MRNLFFVGRFFFILSKKIFTSFFSTHIDSIIEHDDSDGVRKPLGTTVSYFAFSTGPETIAFTLGATGCYGHWSINNAFTGPILFGSLGLLTNG